MAERQPSEASERKLAASPAATLRGVLGIDGHLDAWMSCARCGCGALAHGYDDPAQRCICGECAGYRRRI